MAVKNCAVIHGRSLHVNVSGSSSASRWRYWCLTCDRELKQYILCHAIAVPGYPERHKQEGKKVTDRVEYAEILTDNTDGVQLPLSLYPGPESCII